MSVKWARLLGLLAVVAAAVVCLRHAEHRHAKPEGHAYFNAAQADRDDDTTDIDDVRLDDGGANDAVMLPVLAPLVASAVGAGSVDDSLPALIVAEASPSRAPPQSHTPLKA